MMNPTMGLAAVIKLTRCVRGRERIARGALSRHCWSGERAGELSRQAEQMLGSNVAGSGSVLALLPCKFLSRLYLFLCFHCSCLCRRSVTAL